MTKPLWKMTEQELRRIELTCLDEDRAMAADNELCARRMFGDEQPDTPCIEWNGWDRPGEY